MRLPPATLIPRFFGPGSTLRALSREIGFYLDALSLVMVLVVTFVGFLIHIYSAEFMIEDEGLQPFLCLHESVCRVDDNAAAGE